jgi:hypothetical protein
VAHSIEYIISACILVLVLLTSTSFAFLYVLPQRLSTSQQQVIRHCESVMAQLVGSPGRPAGWGGSLTYKPDDLQELGLAVEEHGLTIPYVLDVDKVNKLVDSDFGITADQVSALLDIEREYLFNLKIYPAIKIDPRPTKTVTVNGKPMYASFKVYVTTHDGIPLPNVNLSSSVMAAYAKTGLGGDDAEVIYYDSDFISASTDWNGSACLDFTNFISSLDGSPVGLVLTVLANYHGIPSTKAFEFGSNPDDTFRAKMVGETILVEIPVDKAPPKGAKHARKAAKVITVDQGLTVGTAEDNLLVFAKVNEGLVNYGSKNYKTFSLSSNEPNMYFVAFVVKSIGKNKLVVVPRLPDYVEFGYKVPSWGTTSMAQVRRMVMIEGAAYYVELTLWKASEF